MSNQIIITGASNFRHILSLSILCKKAVIIKEIRQHEKPSGINEYESSLLQLINKMMNGSFIEISLDGSSVTFRPGTLVGGTIKHACSLQRGIGYYLEFVLWIIIHLKTTLNLTLEGATHSREDPSVDYIQNSHFSVLNKFGFRDKLSLLIKRRGCQPLGGGSCTFTCEPLKTFQSINLTKCGKFKKIRGTAYSMRVSPKTGNDIFQQSKGILLKFTPDVYITTDHYTSFSSGLSPGYGLLLCACSEDDIMICGESCSYPKGSSIQSCVTDVAIAATNNLLQEIHITSCVDSCAVSLVLIGMAVGPQSVSKVILASPSRNIIELLRYIKLFLGVVFKIAPSEHSDTFVFSCCGAGIKNFNKSTI